MQKIIPHIWFETTAKEAADFYVSVFPESSITSDSTMSDTPSGDARVIGLNIFGTDFQFLNAGPFYDRNPSFSYMVSFKTPEEADAVWEKLLPDAFVMMPYGEYPFSKKYGWLKDKFGVSWQIMIDGGMPVQRVTPSLLFVGNVCGRAEEAMNYWCSVFKDAAPMPGHISRYAAGQAPDKEGTLNYARFQIGGQEFVCMDSAHDHKFAFNEMQSFVINCKDQAELDYFTEKLSTVPEAEQCGWVKDQFGVSWQIVPEAFGEIMATANPEQKKKVVAAFLKMKRFDIEALKKAAQ